LYLDLKGQCWGRIWSKEPSQQNRLQERLGNQSLRYFGSGVIPGRTPRAGGSNISEITSENNPEPATKTPQDHCKEPPDPTLETPRILSRNHPEANLKSTSGKQFGPRKTPGNEPSSYNPTRCARLGGNFVPRPKHLKPEEKT